MIKCVLQMWRSCDTLSEISNDNIFISDIVSSDVTLNCVHSPLTGAVWCHCNALVDWLIDQNNDYYYYYYYYYYSRPLVTVRASSRPADRTMYFFISRGSTDHPWWLLSTCLTAIFFDNVLYSCVADRSLSVVIMSVKAKHRLNCLSLCLSVCL